MAKKLLIAVLAVVVLLVIAVAAFGLFFDANQFRPRLEATMSEAF